MGRAAAVSIGAAGVAAAGGALVAAAAAGLITLPVQMTVVVKLMFRATGFVLAREIDLEDRMRVRMGPLGECVLRESERYEQRERSTHHEGGNAAWARDLLG